MALIRTILALVIIVILFHAGMFYMGVDRATNGLTEGIYSLAELLESPIVAIIELLPLTPQQRNIGGANGFYVTALGAAAGYFILYLLLGIGRRD